MIPKWIVQMRNPSEIVLKANLAHIRPQASKMMAQGLQNEAQGHPKQLEWSPKGMPCSKQSKQRNQSNQSKQARPAIESSNHRIIEFKGPAAGGEALHIRRTPSGELGVLDLLSESAESEASGRPPPLPPAPTQSAPKSIIFLTSQNGRNKFREWAHSGGSWGSIGTYFGAIWITFF